MQEHLFSKVDIDVANTHVPDGAAPDLKAAARDYEDRIRAAGGIDVQLLGIGEAGHIGFNEPLSSLVSRTRDKALTPTTRLQNAGMFGGDPERVPKRALTMGVGTILDARELILLATGPAKANIIARAVEGPITSMVSASAIQLHPNCKVIVDEAAAAELKGREYYDFVFANEPEWAEFRD
jgi:glucosamine-6-phosphate deaminase